MFRMLTQLLAEARRRPISPPPLPDDLAQATFPELKRYVQYQDAMLRRRSRDPGTPAAARQAAAERADGIRSLLRAHPLLDDLRRCIRNTRRELGDEESERGDPGCGI